MALFQRRDDSPQVFADRDDAGQQLAVALSDIDGVRPIVLALPRGGVPVAVPVAEALGAPLDVLVVRKLGVPWNPEFGFGAVGEGGVAVVDKPIIRQLRLSEGEVSRVLAAESAEVERRLAQYRDGRPAPDLRGRTAIVVDDGVATGSTLTAAIALLRDRGVARVVVAVPVGAADSVAKLRKIADDVVVLSVPSNFRAVGMHYRDFAQLSDGQVQDLLAEVAAAAPLPPAAAATSSSHDAGQRRTPTDAATAAAAIGLPVATDHEVRIPAEGVTLAGFLHVPTSKPSGVVIFVHGSGSSRLSPRNVTVARRLQERGMATLLFDLLTPAEEAEPSRAPVFDIALLARRLVAVTKWVGAEHLPGVPVGYFGASTGGGAALVAAAEVMPPVAAVVSRGGRPDLAGEALPHVVSPTLLLVGGRDPQVLDLNRKAAARLLCYHQLVVVPGASHLFSEPGTLEQVCDLAGDWFTRWFSPQTPP